MEGYRRKPRRYSVDGEVWGVQDKRKRKDREKGQASKQVEGEEHLEIYRRFRTLELNLVTLPNGLSEKKRYNSDFV